MYISMHSCCSNIIDVTVAESSQGQPKAPRHSALNIYPCSAAQEPWGFKVLGFRAKIPCATTV